MSSRPGSSPSLWVAFPLHLPFSLLPSLDQCVFLTRSVGRRVARCLLSRCEPVSSSFVTIRSCFDFSVVKIHFLTRDRAWFCFFSTIAETCVAFHAGGSSREAFPGVIPISLREARAPNSCPFTWARPSADPLSRHESTTPSPVPLRVARASPVFSPVL